MLWSAIQARQSLSRQTMFTACSLKDGVLSYTATLEGHSHQISSEWTRVVWMSAYNFSESLQGLAQTSDEVLAACRMDWEEKIDLGNCYVKNSFVRYQFNKKWFKEPVENAACLQVCRALRLGYYIIEIPGQGLLVRSPRGRQNGVEAHQCECGDRTGQCIHRLMFKYFTENRSAFQELFNEFNREYQRRLSLVRDCA